jgi:hypothetical protein
VIAVRVFERLWQPPSPGEKCNPEQDNDAGRYLPDTLPLKTEDGAYVVLAGIGSRGPSLQEGHEVSEDPHVAPSSMPRVEWKIMVAPARYIYGASGVQPVLYVEQLFSEANMRHVSHGSLALLLF